MREAGGASSERERSPQEKAELDIHLDENVMRFMTTNLMQEDWNRRERRRINMRIQLGYHLDAGRICKDGLIVPKPEERGAVVQHVHEELGHAGRERTLAAIMKNYYWTDRVVTVRRIVGQCRHCQLTKKHGSMRSGDAQLHSIPVVDFMYRVAIDTAGPLKVTKRGC